MSEISAKYNPESIEDKWYKFWLENKYFHSEPDDREPYTVVIPPPNVTGVLHMGHMLNNTIQDVLVRKARMEGKNACWVPGTDHASIATEAKVVAKLKSEGIEKSQLTREEFLKHAWEWTEKHGGIILEQLKKLGASCDWDRTRFTLEPDLYDAVITVFIDLYNKGYIYRGVRMINWDPAAQTALSDEEVIYKEVQSKLYYIEYPIVGSDEKVTIATTRPETILGDTAICINPNDERYKHLKGKKALVPLINREIPIIFDGYVDMEFGTGCLKVTPAHDLNDYELGIKHNLPSIDILNDDGTLSEAAQLYVGEDRFTVREKIAEELKEKGFLKKVETITNNVGFSERTDAVIEPKLSLQWFCKMDKLAKPALENVMNDNIKFYPSKFKNSYKHWMENIKDWCISRQLWWGQQIPAWYYGEGANDFVVAKTKEEALKLIENKLGKPVNPEQVKQDEDVLDTWFSSWLWPISVFDGFKDPHNKDIEYYYPTNDLVTAPEIMFFWVARMIMAGYEYRGEKPFENVYYTGIVRDKQGRKMSKSLGNSPDPIDLMKKYGADGVRVGMLLSSPAGNDLLFDESLCEQGRNFANKIWNAFRLTRSWQVEEKEQPAYAKDAVLWMEENIKQKVNELNDAYAKFRISDALMMTYRLIWDDFCSWYLEIVKPPFGEAIDAETFAQTNHLFEKLLGLLHPFMPFLTEEIWQHLAERKENETIMFLPWPKSENANTEVLNAFEFAKEIVSGIRTIRKDKQIPNKEKVDLFIKENETFSPDFLTVVKKLGNIDNLEKTGTAPENAFSFRVKSNEYFVPLGDKINIEEELKKLEEELKYVQGFKKSVEKKLSNERFVNNAPEQVVANERKKLADAEAKIKVLQEQMKSLKNSGNFIDEINENIIKLWKSYKDLFYNRLPLLYPDLKQESILFIGLNPSYGKNSFSKIFKDFQNELKEIFNIDNINDENYQSILKKFYEKNEELTSEEKEIIIKIELKSRENHSYFKKAKDIVSDINKFNNDETSYEFEQIDLFCIRETSQKLIQTLINKNNTKTFVDRQMEITAKLLKELSPKVIVVENALAREIMCQSEYFFKNNKEFKMDFTLGTYVCKLNGRIVPVFFTSPLSGRRALDNGSYNRLKWHIWNVLKQIDDLNNTPTNINLKLC